MIVHESCRWIQSFHYTLLCILIFAFRFETPIAASVQDLKYAATRNVRHTPASFFTALRQLINKPFDTTIERKNFTIVFERLQLKNIPGKGPLMYCRSDNPFDPNCSSKKSVRAYQSIDSNDDGHGDGSCASGGNGARTIGSLDPFHFFASLNQTIDFSGTRANLTGLRLSEFRHINIIDGKKPWNVSGEAGDTRMYVNGSFEMKDGNNKKLLYATNVKWFQNLTYPAPIGNVKGETPKIAAYFIGSIVEFDSDEEWVDLVDPYVTGYMLGVVRASALGFDDCYRVASFWITIRAFPDMGIGTYESNFIEHNTADTGAKVGPYAGSQIESVERAESYANLSLTLTVSTIAAVSTASTVITAAAIMLPTASLSTVTIPGNGASRMIRNGAFIARLGQIRGFHTDSFNQFSRKMEIFLVKFPFPFAKTNKETTRSKRKFRGRDRRKKINISVHSIRQVNEDDSDEDSDEDDDDPSVSDDVFKGCAFYTMTSVGVVLVIHVIVGLWIRKKPIEEQVGPHAWMIYILSMVMEYVHTSSILNASQYFRSHIGMGTGKAILYFVAVIQFLVIGLGFFFFTVIVVALALHRLHNHDVHYLPKFKHPDPDIRRNAVVAGQYEAEDDNFFHGVFEGVYSGLVGPRIWLVLIETFVGFVDTVVTAVIWDELIVLTILVALYGFLYIFFLVLNPYVDKIEGRLVSILALFDLVLLFLEFLSALGNYETAETMDNIAVSLAAVSMAVGFLITFYCDIIPTSLAIWEWIRGWVFAGLRKLGLLVPADQDSLSDWSAFSTSFMRTSSEREGGSDDPVPQIHIHGSSSSETQAEEEPEERFIVPIGLSPSLWRRRSVLRWRRQDQEDTTEDFSFSSQETPPTRNYRTGVVNFVRDTDAIAERIDVSERRIESVWDLGTGYTSKSGHTD